MNQRSKPLQRFNHILAWVTVILFIFFALSGYGITNPEATTQLTGGIFTRAFSLYLHLKLAAPVLILLLIHVLIGGKTALTRWGLHKEKLLDTLLVLVGLFVAGIIIWLQYFVS